MGFWNALSVLAPVAPALSDAQDIRTARQQDAAKFAQDQDLKQAQLTVQQLAAQSEQQRIRAGNQPLYKPGSQPEYSSDLGVMAQPVWTGEKYELQPVPGDTPQQQEEYRIKSFAKNRSILQGILPPGTSDETLDYAAYTYGGMKPPPTHKFTPLPGAAGQAQIGPDGKSYVIYGRDENEDIVSKPIDANFKPPVKPLSPSAQYANLLTKQILANRKQGPPLTNEEAAQLPALQQALDGPGIARMKAMAEYNAANRLFMGTDPNTNMEIAVPISAGVAAFNRGTPLLAGAYSSPIGAEKNRQDFSNSGILQVNTMRDIIGRNGGLFGPGAGRLQNFVNWAGSNSPDAQRFRSAALILADHSAGVFGGRSVKTVDELKDTITSMKLTPEALLAGLDQDETTFKSLMGASGRLGAPQTGGTGSTGGAGGATAKHKLGEKKTFPNGNEGAWDGTGWRVTKLAKAAR